MLLSSYRSIQRSRELILFYLFEKQTYILAKQESSMYKSKITLITFILIFSCEDNPGNNNNDSIISVLYPTSDSIIMESVTISLEIQDEDNVYKVELWMNGDSTENVDYDAPFALELDTRNYDNGINTFFIRLYEIDGAIHDSEDINFWINNFLVFSTLFGTPGKDEEGYSILQKPDSNFVVLGNTDNDILLLEVSNSGEVMWNQSYGGSQTDEAHHFEQTTDGGYIISGSTQSYGFGGSDIWLIKSGSDGLIEWNTYIGTENDEQGGQVLQTNDGGYIIIGNHINNQNSDVWVIKTNSQGDSLWTKTYGGDGNELGSDIIFVENQGYLLLGSTTSYGNGDSDIFLIKIDELGNQEWFRSYGIGSDDIGQAIIQSRDGGYVIQFLVEGYGDGNTAAGLMKVDFEGNVLWTKAFGGTINTKSKMFSVVNSSEYISVCSQLDYSTNSSNTWLIKIDDNGEIIWEKIFGKNIKDDGFAVAPTLDNGFVITGRSNSFGDSDVNLFDLWILKTDPSGYSKFE